jgi:membrane protein
LLAIEVLQQLSPLRDSPPRGLTMTGLSQRHKVDALQLEPVLEALVELDWVGQLQEEREDGEARYVLLANPDSTPLQALLHTLLLPCEPSTLHLWENGRWHDMTLRQAL